MARELWVDGKYYELVENLGVQGGYRAKMVMTDDGERVVVWRNDRWEWWTVEDRIGHTQGDVR